MHLEEVGVMVGVGLMAQAGTNDGHCLVHSSPPRLPPPIRKDVLVLDSLLNKKSKGIELKLCNSLSKGLREI